MAKNKAAVALAKLRNQKTTPEQRREIARAGGLAPKRKRKTELKETE